MFFAHLPVHEQITLAFAAMALMLSFGMLVHPRVVTVVKMFALQGLFVSIVTALAATIDGAPHLYFSALLTLVLKVILIPYMLFRMIKKFDMYFVQDEVLHPVLTILGAGALVIFCYDRTLPIAVSAASLTGHLIAICMSIVLIGMVMLISRKTAISQVAGFMTIENGLFFAAVSITDGMPMIVEFGVAFDVLVASVIFGVFFLHIKESIESLNIGSMADLSEKDS